MIAKDTKNGMIFGVCAGLADYFQMDVTLMRLLFVIGLLCGSLTFWVYLILAIIMPSQQK